MFSDNGLSSFSKGVDAAPKKILIFLQGCYPLKEPRISCSFMQFWSISYVDFFLFKSVCGLTNTCNVVQ